jgi:hypothetical protein
MNFVERMCQVSVASLVRVCNALPTILPMVATMVLQYNAVYSIAYQLTSPAINC